MQGRSLVGLLEGREGSSHEAVFAERNWHGHSDSKRCVRTSRYKPIYNGCPEQPCRSTSDAAASAAWQSYLAESNSRRSSLNPITGESVGGHQREAGEIHVQRLKTE